MDKDSPLKRQGALIWPSDREYQFPNTFDNFPCESCGMEKIFGCCPGCAPLVQNFEREQSRTPPECNRKRCRTEEDDYDSDDYDDYNEETPVEAVLSILGRFKALIAEKSEAYWARGGNREMLGTGQELRELGIIPEEFGLVEIDRWGNPRRCIEELLELHQKGTPEDLSTIGVYYEDYGYRRIEEFMRPRTF